jgi:hypothetical protein
MDTLMDRVDKLERQNRSLRRFVVALSVLAACVPLMGQVPSPSVADEIRARRVVIVDDKGRVRADLAVLGDGSAVALDFRDEAGQIRAELVHSKEGPALILGDGSGQVRAALEAGDDRVGLTLKDSNGKRRLGLAAVKDQSGLQLFDEAETVQASLGLRKTGPALSLRNGNEKAFAILGILGDDPSLRLEDVRGNSAWLGARESASSAAHLSLKDKQSEKTWQAP